MSYEILISNLTNPTLLFFALGVFAVLFKSDLEIPSQSVKFISIYLLFSIGFKGGQELAHSTLTLEMVYGLLFGVIIATLIPLYVFFILKNRINIVDAGAIAATYGSVSAVTFVTAISFLELIEIPYNGYMVAVMALMEAPAIVMGVLLIKIFDKNELNSKNDQKLLQVIKHSFSNGSVLIILGSLIIGLVSDSKQAEGIRPFTTDIFKGFLAIFLLDLGMVTARRFKSFQSSGSFLIILAIALPLINGITIAWVSQFVLSNSGDRFLMAVLSASASYIAVPAAMKFAVPSADPGLYLPMSLGLTFPINITIGMPIFMAIISL